MHFKRFIPGRNSHIDERMGKSSIPVGIIEGKGYINTINRKIDIGKNLIGYGIPVCYILVRT